jgi:hypothetical protein
MPLIVRYEQFLKLIVRLKIIRTYKTRTMRGINLRMGCMAAKVVGGTYDLLS